MDNGELELAAELLAEGERISELAEVSDPRNPDQSPQWRLRQFRATLRGDLAVLQGQPTEALHHYARSLELAQQQGHQVQVYWELTWMADAMALSGRDTEALEIAGMAEAHIAELGVERPPGWHVQDIDRIQESAERIGARATEKLRARGRAVAAASRIARACTLARARQPVGV
jgi:hypothetical protein